MDTKTLELDAVVDNLSQVNSIIEQQLVEAGASPKMINVVLLVLEELFVNVCHYAYAPNTGKIKVISTIKDNTIQITFEDTGIPFNPIEKKDPLLNVPIEERKIGGLGIFLVKKNVDDLNYNYQNGKNIFTIFKVLS